MCGRTACTLAPEEIQKETKASFEDASQYKPSYNVAPQTTQPIVFLAAEGGRAIKMMKWGLVPSWSTDGKMKNARTINAKSETLSTSNMWSRLVKKQRCIAVANGYFEWHEHNGKKFPYYIHHKDGKLLKIAALYDVWVDPKTNEKTFTYSVITTNANKKMAYIHPRMPAILEEEEDVQLWLDSSKEGSSVLALLKPYEGNSVVFYQVEGFVNSVKNNTERCIKAADQQKGRIDYFFKKKEPLFTVKRTAEEVAQDDEEEEEEKPTEKGKEKKKAKPEKKKQVKEEEEDEEEEEEEEKAPTKAKASPKSKKTSEKPKKAEKLKEEEESEEEEEEEEPKKKKKSKSKTVEMTKAPAAGKRKRGEEEKPEKKKKEEKEESKAKPPKKKKKD